VSEFKPGDVAMITAYNQPEPYRAYYDGKTWRECDGNCFCVDVPMSVRPLVVIDPEDREQVERLMDPLRRMVFAPHACGAMDCLTTALREFAKPTPPKPAEPLGLGAVVEDAEGLRWVHYLGRVGWKWCGSGPDHDGVREYADIDAVRVLSEGVTDA
jgi:hypothetical protein